MLGEDLRPISKEGVRSLVLCVKLELILAYLVLVLIIAVPELNLSKPIQLEIKRAFL